jgi:hypothetical protein
MYITTVGKNPRRKIKHVDGTRCSSKSVPSWKVIIPHVVSMVGDQSFLSFPALAQSLHEQSNN